MFKGWPWNEKLLFLVFVIGLPLALTAPPLIVVGLSHFLGFL